nr:PREDICTED: uncharacterized protein LOC106705865 isoform X2 [Latimeria chalumnae]|eukprot:XP_014351405.1 PREDICTED: uncharacterized protein LOC106705865 isoform X2 [Latimeria chalumnae]
MRSNSLAEVIVVVFLFRIAKVEVEEERGDKCCSKRAMNDNVLQPVRHILLPPRQQPPSGSHDDMQPLDDVTPRASTSQDVATTSTSRSQAGKG